MAHSPLGSRLEDEDHLIPPTSQSSRPCVILKNKTCFMLQKLIAMAKCNAMSRKLVSTMSEELKKCIPAYTSNEEPVRLLDCRSCDGCMTNPVCLPCGHSICLLCIEKSNDSIKCPICHDSYPVKPIGSSSTRRPTVLILNMCSKLLPNEVQCCTYRAEGNKCANQNDFHMAIQHYNKAIETGVPDHRVYSNRSRAYLAIDETSFALKDAEHCCLLKPFWPKAHYRRGVALNKLGHLNDAAAAFLLSLHLGGVEQSITKVLCQLIENIAKKCSNQFNQQQLVIEIVSIAMERLSHYEKSSPTNVKQEQTLLPIEESDFECILCTCLLYNPVTVPCGHTFCQMCLARLFDHSPYCPVCRSSLGEMFAQYTQSSGSMSIDQTLHKIISSHFPHLYEEKKAAVEAELLRHSRVGLSEVEEIPIFILTIGYPSISAPLHVFEPRYRLMIRRCIESNSRRFGICAPNSNNDGFVDYGTVLFISSLEYTPDGRSLINTLGERRFQVIERGTRDGYAVARIRFITDDPIDDSLEQLQHEVYEHCTQWLYSLPLFTRLNIMQHICSPPPLYDTPTSTTDGPSWVWWYINAIPISLHNKLQFLCSTSLRHRLLLLKQMLTHP